MSSRHSLVSPRLEPPKDGMVISSNHSCLELCTGVWDLLLSDPVCSLYEGIEISSRNSFVTGIWLAGPNDGIVTSSRHSLVITPCLDLCIDVELFALEALVLSAYEGIDISSMHSFVSNPGPELANDGADIPLIF